MDSGLVDLSLFAYSPGLDHFGNIDRTDRHQLYSTATWPTRTERTIPQPLTNKPLPKRPRKNIYDFCMPTTGSRCVLRRIKRVKLDTVRGEHRRQLQSIPSAYASAPSAYINPNTIRDDQIASPTIQARRNRTERELTLPSSPTATTSTGLPMVWLPDEQMWLVADPTDPSYGYYAAGPDDGVDWLPPYTENDSPASEPSQSDFSPVREQFMSLMEPPQSPLQPPQNRLVNDRQRMSPMFQEALAGVGVGVLDFNESASDYNLRPTQQQQQKNREYIPYSPWPPARTEQRPSRNDPTPSALQPGLRSESPALRSQKFMTSNELARQRERQARIRQAGGGGIPYGQKMDYKPSHLSRRESWHSDITSPSSSALEMSEGWSPWPVRSSSARH